MKELEEMTNEMHEKVIVERLVYQHLREQLIANRKERAIKTKKAIGLIIKIYTVVVCSIFTYHQMYIALSIYLIIGLSITYLIEDKWKQVN